MSTLLYGMQRTSVPGNEKEVRSTVTVVENDEPEAMLEHAPDFNELDTDPDTQGGLTPHQLASNVTASQKYVPTLGNANEDLNGIVDRQISTSGTAAAREASGQWGHGTMLVVDGIEPTIRDGNAFGETYFDAGGHTVQAGAGNYMSPSLAADNPTLSKIQATGNKNARAAVSPYSLWYDGVTKP